MDLQYKSNENPSFKASEEKGAMTFEGYLSVFGNVDSYGDIVERGAYAKTISKVKEKGRGLPVLLNHGAWKMSASDAEPIGFFSDLEEDSYGLKVKGQLFNTQRGRDIYTLLKESPEGFMGMSIGYFPIKTRNATREENAEKGVTRYIEEVELLEGSIVTFPANEASRVDSVKSLDVQSIRNIEKALKDEGFSSKDAKHAVGVFKSILAGEVPSPSTNVNTSEDEAKSAADAIEATLASWEEKREIEKSLAALSEALSKPI